LAIMGLGVEDPRSIASAAGEVAAGTPWVEMLVVFGSAACGRLRADSDIDVGWLGLPPSGEAETALLAALERRLGREVHLVDLRLASDLLRIEVVRTALLAFERAAGRWTSFAGESMSRWSDIEPFVRRCAEAVRRRALEGAGGSHG
jgi:predicted nucleotidyltransferase